MLRACIVAEPGRNADPFMLHLFAALAEKERSLISERTKAGCPESGRCQTWQSAQHPCGRRCWPSRWRRPTSSPLPCFPHRTRSALPAPTHLKQCRAPLINTAFGRRAMVRFVGGEAAGTRDTTTRAGNLFLDRTHAPAVRAALFRRFPRVTIFDRNLPRRRFFEAKPMIALTNTRFLCSRARCEPFRLAR